MVQHGQVHARGAVARGLDDVDHDGDHHHADRERDALLVQIGQLAGLRSERVEEGLEAGPPVGRQGEHEPQDAEDGKPRPPRRVPDEVLAGERGEERVEPRHDPGQRAHQDPEPDGGDEAETAVSRDRQPLGQQGEVLERGQQDGEPEGREDRVQGGADPLVHLAEPLRDLPVEAPRERHAADEDQVHGTQQEGEQRPPEAHDQPDRPQPRFDDGAHERQGVRLPQRQVRIAQPEQAAPADLSGEHELLRQEVDVHRVHHDGDRERSEDRPRMPRLTFPRTSPAM